MADIYSYLHNEVAKDVNVSSGSHRSKLCEWLRLLALGDAPRSVAAKALGLLQYSPEHPLNAESQELATIWRRFGSDFLQGKIASRPRVHEPSPLSALQPTRFHKLVAKWIVDRTAFAVSVNFDGLTRKAIQQYLTEKELDGQCALLTTAEQIVNFFVGGDNLHLYPLVKVWGDVFHATCDIQRCPLYGSRTAIYDLSRHPTGLGQLSATELRSENVLRVSCPECGSTMRLQLFFPGYREKEESTTELLDEIWRFVSPRVCGIVIAGFSGLWDDALSSFIVGLALRNATDPDFAVHVIDHDPKVYIAERLRSSGVSCNVLSCDTDASAEGSDPRVRSNSRTAHGETSSELTTTWRGLFDSSKPRMAWKSSVPVGYSQLFAPSYAAQIQPLRQIGLKSRLHETEDSDEVNSRIKHARDAAHLAWYWTRRLENPRKSRVSLCESIAMFSAFHRGFGKLPFGNITEELFHEVHWSFVPFWFLGGPAEKELDSGDEVPKLTAEGCITRIAEEFGITFKRASHLAMRAIEGRSGWAALDAAVNSPLDTHKMCYVCDHLQYANTVGNSGSGPHRDEEWIREFVDGQSVLPSGLIGIRGRAAEHAHALILQRRWLYTNFYLLPTYRVVERIAKEVLGGWLLRRVPREMASRHRNKGYATCSLIRDVSAEKGAVACDLIWEELRRHLHDGEPGAILSIADHLFDELESGVPTVPASREWIRDCRTALRETLDHKGEKRSSACVSLTVKRVASWSTKMISQLDCLDRITRIARHIQATYPFTAMFDISVVPPLLGYSPGRRYVEGKMIVGEVFAVPSEDPDHWGRPSRGWVPLAQSDCATRDTNRYVQIVIVSPRGGDSGAIRSCESMFRRMCGAEGIVVTEQ